MKKIRRYLPVLILVLALLILFWPAGNNDTGTEPALPTTEPVSSSPDAGALPDQKIYFQSRMLNPVVVRTWIIFLSKRICH